MSWGGRLVSRTSSCLWRKSGGVRRVPLPLCHCRRSRCITKPQVISVSLHLGLMPENTVLVVLWFLFQSDMCPKIFVGQQITKSYLVCFFKPHFLCYLIPPPSLSLPHRKLQRLDISGLARLQSPGLVRILLEEMLPHCQVTGAEYEQGLIQPDTREPTEEDHEASANTGVRHM